MDSEITAEGLILFLFVLLLMYGIHDKPTNHFQIALFTSELSLTKRQLALSKLHW